MQASSTVEIDLLIWISKAGTTWSVKLLHHPLRHRAQWSVLVQTDYEAGGSHTLNWDHAEESAAREHFKREIEALKAAKAKEAMKCAT